ncbi:hypothetical protein PLESTB_000018600 [Pleodorina starrii]|uniref:Uncharacterized protein n=1 Tax=Pleodorina starrii TaxID=330485 RepID=A0A9W6B9N1_9CHLO|nr:hypothetical protein PLESTB_000018600 [Pleodorina starrii]GLC70868.1 hypothetical protein PLESTF_001041600 [Pleodorina starrii]
MVAASAPSNSPLTKSRSATMQRFTPFQSGESLRSTSHSTCRSPTAPPPSRKDGGGANCTATRLSYRPCRTTLPSRRARARNARRPATASAAARATKQPNNKRDQRNNKHTTLLNPEEGA